MKNYLSTTFNASPKRQLGEPSVVINQLPITAVFGDWEVVEDSSGKSYVLFEIRLSNKLIDYTIKRRFSQFEALHEALKKSMKALELKAKLKLPEKYIFKNFDREKIKQRKENLQKYLNDLLADFDFYNPDKDIKEFIELKSSQIDSVVAVNQSNINLMNEADITYLKLIFDSDQLSKRLEGLKMQLVNWNRMTAIENTLRMIINGKQEVPSIFDFAFASKNELKPRQIGPKSQQSSSVLEKSQKTSKSLKKMSFNEQPRSKFEIFRPKKDSGSDKQHRENHIRCATITSWVLEMLDYARNDKAHIFRSVLCKMNIENFESTNIKQHLACAEFTLCKMNIYELLKIFKDVSKSSRQNSECLLFPTKEEHNQFLNWYYAQNPYSVRRPTPENDAKAFPMTRELVFREHIRKDALVKVMNHFSDKFNLGVMTYDETNKLTKSCFKIARENYQNFVVDMMDFKWNQNVLFVGKLPGGTLTWQKDCEYQPLWLLWQKNEGFGQVYFSLCDYHKLSLPGREILVYSPSEGSPISPEQAREIYETRTGQSLKNRKIEVSATDSTLFCDITLPNEQAKRPYALASLLFGSAFPDRKTDPNTTGYDYLKSHIKWVLLHVQKKGWFVH